MNQITRNVASFAMPNIDFYSSMKKYLKNLYFKQNQGKVRYRFFAQDFCC